MNLENSAKQVVLFFSSVDLSNLCALAILAFSCCQKVLYNIQFGGGGAQGLLSDFLFGPEERGDMELRKDKAKMVKFLFFGCEVLTDAFPLVFTEKVNFDIDYALISLHTSETMKLLIMALSYFVLPSIFAVSVISDACGIYST